MLTISERLGHYHGDADDTITLDFDTRQKARIKVTTDKGEPVGIFIARGKPLRVGEHLRSECGKVIKVIGALEAVTTASTDDWHTFSKVCYHLGNRHTPIEITELIVRFQPDHVLANMCSDWGLTVKNVERPFYPESGAYGKHAEHRHGH